jgi:hypothetical protein
VPPSPLIRQTTSQSSRPLTACQSNRGIQSNAATGNTTQLVQARLRQAQQNNGGGGAQVTVGLTSNLTVGGMQTTMISGSPVTLVLPTQTSFVPVGSATSGASPWSRSPSALVASAAALLVSFLPSVL